MTVPGEQMVGSVAWLPAWSRRLGYYGLALLFVAVAALLRWAFSDVLSLTPFLIFYLALVGAAAFGGLGPGLLATLASWLCIDFLFDPTPGHIGFDNSMSVVRLLVFLAGGLVVSAVGERMRRTRTHERRQAGRLAELARSLESEKDTLQAVMNGARNSHLVYLDRDFNFVRVNEAYARTCGYTPQEMIGKNHFALYPDAENEAIFARVRDTGVPFEVHDKPFVFPDQPERGITYWDWTLTPIKNDASYVEGLVFSLFETTQRKQAEEALRESEQRLSLAQQVAHVGTFDWDIRTGVNVWTPELEGMYGLPPGGFAKTQQAWEQLVHPDDRVEAQRLVDRAFETSVPTEGEWRVIWPDGSVHWLSGRWQVFKDESGTPLRMTGVNIDITDRKRAEEALRESEDKFKAIFNRAALGLAISDSTGLILDCNSAYQEMMGYRKEELQQKHFLDITHPDDISKNRALQQQLNDRLIDTYQLEKRYLRQDGRVVWCNLVASAIRNPDGTLKYNMAVAEDITRRKDAEEALRASEASLAKAQTIAHLANWEVDVRTNLVRGSQELYHLFALQPDVALDTYVEKFHPEDRPRVVESIRAAIREGQPYSIDYRIVPRPGVMRWVHAEGAITCDDRGRPLTFFGTVQDITERKRAEELLRESEERFRTMADGSPNPIWVTNAAGERIFANRQYREYFGVSAAEIEGGQWKPFVHPDDAPTYVDSFLSSLQEHRPFFAEARVKRADGQWRWIESHAEPRFSVGGEFLGFVGITQDIMERKEAEAALKESEEKYRRIVETATEGIVMVDAEARIIFVNARWSEIFGYSSEEAAHITLFDMVFPEDMVRMRERWESRKHGQKETYESRFRRKDGRPVWILGGVAPRFDSEGEFLGTLVLNTDITERKQAEEALREWNATLESRVAERTAELEHRARQLQKLTLELSEAEERERERLAAVLHDDLQQVLAAAKFHLSRVGSGTRSPAQSQEIVELVKQMLKDAIEKSRALSHELSPVVLHRGDVAETLGWLAEQMQAKHGLRVRVDAFGAVQAQSDVVKAFVYRAAQELLFNVVKHARVNEARIRIRRLGRYLCLSVSDRGRGFDPQEIKATAGFGLLSIRERVALLGGRMKTRTVKGRGTTFRIVVPDTEPLVNGAPPKQRPNDPAPTGPCM
jgi:PAS domain S-box-containing protein